MFSSPTFSLQSFPIFSFHARTLGGYSVSDIDSTDLLSPKKIFETGATEGFETG